MCCTAKGLIATARRMAELGLVIGSFGNVSCLQEDTILITPTRLDYFRMEPADLVMLDLAGKKLSGRREPSSEFRLHVTIYGTQPDAQAIVHTHSAYALALSLVTTELPMLTEEMEYGVGGNVPVAPFVPAGTQELADQAADILQGIPSKALILAHHGVVGFGQSLNEALLICQLVERNAKIYLLTQPR